MVPTNMFVRKFVGFAYEGFGQEVWKAFAKSLGPFVFGLFYSVAYRVTPHTQVPAGPGTANTRYWQQQRRAAG